MQDMLHFDEAAETETDLILAEGPTERIWLFNGDPTSHRCLTRISNNQVFMDWCIENHFDKQQWQARDKGTLGFRTPEGEAFCLTANERRLKTAKCISSNEPSQVFEFKPSVGLVHVASNLCVTAPGLSYIEAVLTPCATAQKQWFMRVNNNIVPIGFEPWLLYFARRRKANMDKYGLEVRQVMNEIATRPRPKYIHRRVVVHFADDHHFGAQPQFRWWVKTWRELKLNEPDQAMDVIIFGGKKVLSGIGHGCEFVTLKEKTSPPPEGSPGVCWLIEFAGAAEREPENYDGWFNSVEILVNKDTRPLLEQYETLLRADADTFPSPRFRDYWLDYVYMGENAAYSTRYARHKLANAAAAMGLNYSSVTNIASTYYGPAHDVLNIAALTVAAGKFARYFLFAEGTPCKLPLGLRPKDAMCEWGSGLHEGVMLLYSQDIAVNHLLTTDIDIRLHPKSQYDAGTTNLVHPCTFLMYHIYHGAERFSKFAFASNNYQNLDMADFDLNTVRDYTTWLALTANNQGKNGDIPFEKVGRDLSKLCDNWKE